MKRPRPVPDPMRPLLALLVLVTAALAGCAENDDPPAASTPATSVDDRACPAPSSAEEPVVTLRTTMGTVCLKLLTARAPVTTAHIAKLVEAGCYDGTKFHRVVKGFMNQGGDPLSKDDGASARWGTGGPGDCGQSPETITEEFYCADGFVSTQTPSSSAPPTQCNDHGGLGMKHDRPGIWSMARTSAPHSSGSQFFLTAAAAAFLDGRYTIFGEAADATSLQVIDSINSVKCGGAVCRDPPQGSNRPDTPIVVVKATVQRS